MLFKRIHTGIANVKFQVFFSSVYLGFTSFWIMAKYAGTFFSETQSLNSQESQTWC